jgi:tetratricopeptide (TPR) repeat protein
LASSSRASKLELASLYEQQGDPGATASIMRVLGDLAPDNVDVLFMAQRVYSELADETLNKLAVLAPGSARMQEIIAQHLINQGIKGTSKAPLITTARHCRSIHERPAFTCELGDAILESVCSDAAAQAEAQKELESAMTVEGDTAKTECELADIAWLQSAPEQALAHYQRAYHLNPNEVQAQMGLAALAMPENPQPGHQVLASGRAIRSPQCFRALSTGSGLPTSPNDRVGKEGITPVPRNQKDKGPTPSPVSPDEPLHETRDI